MNSEIDYKKIFLEKVIEAKWCQKGAKIPPPKTLIFVCQSLRTSLLCIVGQLAEGGSVAVAIVVIDM